MRLQEIIDQVPEIANYRSQIPILRLPNSNKINLNDQIYELRLFTFYLKNNNQITFSEFVHENNLQNEEIKISPQHKHFPVYSYSLLNDETYIVLSLSPTDIHQLDELLNYDFN